MAPKNQKKGLGSIVPPTVGHCFKSYAIRGGNQHETWINCRLCAARLMTISKKTEETTYFHLPKCELEVNKSLIKKADWDSPEYPWLPEPSRQSGAAPAAVKPGRDPVK